MNEVPPIVLAEVCAGYGTTPVIRDTTLSVERGITLLAAENGAGKTTFLRLCAGILRPLAGEVRVLAGDPYADPAIRARIGYLSHQSGLDPRLTVADNLEFWARVRGYSGQRGRLAVSEVIEELGLGELAAKAAAMLSRGQRQRAALARALLGDSELLLLDEPASGLDPEWYDAVTRVLERRTAERGASVLLASHDPRDHATGWQVLGITEGVIRRRDRDAGPGWASYVVTVASPTRVAESGSWRIEYPAADPAAMRVTLTVAGALGAFISAVERAGATIVSVQRDIGEPGVGAGLESASTFLEGRR